MKTNTVTFAAPTRYEFSAGHKPRGFGAWAFEADFGDTSLLIWTPSMTYSAAKAHAKTEVLNIAAAAGYSGSIELEVQP